MQDVFVTELVKRRRFRVVGRQQLDALVKERGLTLSGDVDPSTARRMGQVVGVNYLLTGAVAEYGVTDKTARGAAFRRGRRGGAPGAGRPFVVTTKASLIDTSTGEVVWADEASTQVSVGGFGGGVDDERLFNRAAKPSVRQLARSLGAARL
jgi:curli biogenesis system outer membrane secretion channel CsgG